MFIDPFIDNDWAVFYKINSLKFHWTNNAFNWDWGGQYDTFLSITKLITWKVSTRF